MLVEMRAYTTGVEIELALHGRADRATSFLPTDQRLADRLHVPVAPTPDISLTAADGTPSVVLQGRELFDQLDDFADRPTLFVPGGEGNGDHMTSRLWLYPFPATTLELGVAWPAQDIAPATTTLTIDDLQRTRDQIIELWPWRAEDELRGLGS
ncbi:hypothetical protein F1C76_15060 [Geodermatophilaceae bacterium NBWT11]|nr:hypothetical protein F1C76_15060 [Geodermatophilaceae bacterium NBWT11]